MSQAVLKAIKISIVTLLILGVLGLGFFLVLFGDSLLEEIRDQIIQRIEEDLPLRVSWERMAVFPINNLVIEGIEVATLEDDEPFFSSERVVVDYSFWELILGRTSAAGSIRNVSIEEFVIMAEDPIAIIPELEEEDFRGRVQLSGGEGIVGWEGRGEEVENISGDFWPVGERGWEGSLQFMLVESPGNWIQLSGYWNPGEFGGRLMVDDFPISIADNYLPDDQVIIREGLVSGEFSLDFLEGEEPDFRGDFRLSSGQFWIGAIEEEIKALSGEFEISPDRIFVKNGMGSLEGLDVKVDGHYLIKDEKFGLTLDLDRFELERIQDLLARTGYWDEGLPDVSGEGNLSLNLKGDLDNPQGEGELNLTRGMVGSFAFTGINSNVIYQGDTLGKNPDLEIEFFIERGWEEDVGFSGMEGILFFKGDTFTQNPVFDLDFSLEHGWVEEGEITGLKGFLSFKGDTLTQNPVFDLDFSLEHGWMEDMEIAGLEGLMTFKGDTLNRNPDVKLDFSLDRGLGNQAEISGVQGSLFYQDQAWLENPFAELSLFVSGGKVDQIEFSRLEGFLSYQEELLSIQEVKGEIAGGIFSIDGQVGSEVLLKAEFADLSPEFWPEEYFWPEEIGRRGDIDGRVMVSGPLNDLEKMNMAGEIRWEDPFLAGMGFQDIEGVFWVDEQKIFLNHLVLNDPTGGRIEVQGRTDFSLERFDFQIMASTINLENYPMIDGFSGEVNFDGRASGSLEKPFLSGSFSGRDLFWGEEPLGNIDGEAEFRENKIFFEQVNLVHPWGEAQVSGDIDLSRDEPEVQLIVDAFGPCLSPVIEEFDLPLELCGEVRLALELEGDLSDPKARGNFELTQGYLAEQPFNYIRTDFSWENETIKYSDLVISAAGGFLRGEGIFRFPGEIELVLEGEKVALGEIREWEKLFPQMQGDASFNLEAKGSWPDFAASGFLQVESILFEGEYLGDIEGDFSFADGFLDLGDLALQGQEGRYSIQGQAQLLPLGELDLVLTTEEASLERLLAVAGLEEFWFPMIPVTLAGEVRVNGTFERPRFDVAGTAFYPAGELEVVGGGYLDGPYEAKIQGPVDFDLISQFLPDDLEVRGNGEVEVFINYDETLKISGNNILKNLAFNGVSFTEVSGIFDWKGDQPVYLEQKLLRPTGESLEIKGNIPLEPDQPGLDLHVLTDGFDLAFLAGFNPFLLSLEGKATVDAKLKGSLNDPQLEGRGGMEEGAFEYFNLPGRVENISGEVNFLGSEMIMENVQGKYSEGGDLALTGKIVFSGWHPDYYDLLLTAEQLHINHGTIDGYGNGEITITGSYFEPALVGYLDVYDTVIGIPFDWPHEEPDEEPEVDPYLELTFRPAGNIRVRDGNFDVQVQSGELVLDNRTGEIELIGEVVSRQGNMNFYNTNFRLIEGRARFLRFGESIPNITATAQTQVRDTQVNVHLDGPALDMNMRLVSQPPMEEQEIIDLLVYRGGLGELLRGDLPGAFRQELWRILGETFRTSFLVELQSTIGDFLELDEFLITPIFLGEEERIEFYVGKAITDRVYITYTQDFRGDGSRRRFSLEYRLLDNLMFSGSVQDEGQFQLGIEFNRPF